MRMSKLKPCLILTLLALLILILTTTTTEAFAEVQQSGDQIVMTKADAKKIVDRMEILKAQNIAKDETITSERELNKQLAQKVEDLIANQTAERELYKEQLAAKNKELNLKDKQIEIQAKQIELSYKKGYAKGLGTGGIVCGIGGILLGALLF